MTQGSSARTSSRLPISPEKRAARASIFNVEVLCFKTNPNALNRLPVLCKHVLSTKRSSGYSTVVLPSNRESLVGFSNPWTCTFRNAKACPACEFWQNNIDKANSQIRIFIISVNPTVWSGPLGPAKKFAAIPSQGAKSTRLLDDHLFSNFETLEVALFDRNLISVNNSDPVMKHKNAVKNTITKTNKNENAGTGKLNKPLSRLETNPEACPSFKIAIPVWRSAAPKEN